MSEKLVDMLRRRRDDAPERAMKLAGEHAAAYIAKTIDRCVEHAGIAADEGRDNGHVWCETVMTHGNLIPAPEVYDRVVAMLLDEGVTASWGIDNAPRTNLRRVIFTISWKDPT